MGGLHGRLDAAHASGVIKDAQISSLRAEHAVAEARAQVRLSALAM